MSAKQRCEKENGGEEWAPAVGEPGRHRMVALADLHIDRRYQRPEVSERNTRSMAESFSWEAFGVIQVAERGNGSLYVVDGHQRCKAAELRGITHVPAVVVPSDGRRSEAGNCQLINDKRVPFGPAYKFHAAVAHGDEPQCEIARELAARGLCVTQNGADPGGVAFAARLVRLWKVDSEASLRALDAQRAIFPGQVLHSEVHMAMWYLERRGVCCMDHAAKFAEAGRSRLLGSIRDATMLNGTGRSTNLRNNGLGLLMVINARRRNKLVLNEEV